MSELFLEASDKLRVLEHLDHLEHPEDADQSVKSRQSRKSNEPRRTARIRLAALRQHQTERDTRQQVWQEPGLAVVLGDQAGVGDDLALDRIFVTAKEVDNDVYREERVDAIIEDLLAERGFVRLVESDVVRDENGRVD